jgi:glucose-6-phosphate isomerase
MFVKDETQFIQPFGVDLDLENGIMLDATHRLERRASDMLGYYQNEEALKELIESEGDPLHYEVFECPVPEEYGHLMYCISTLQPGRIGDECYMTKGHYHTVLETSEIYLCLKGEGFMMMKTPEGEWKTEKMVKGRMVYVPAYWAHRSINTGDTPLISFCVYPGDAGHNYGDIIEDGFPARVFLKDKEIIIEEEQ